jgi:hypothetical protein
VRRPMPGSTDQVDSARIARIDLPLLGKAARDRLIALIRARLDRENAT